VVLTARSLAGGRQTVDESWALRRMPFSIVAPNAIDQRWKLLALDDAALRRLEPSALMDLLADTEPGYSRALYDALRLGNPGWTLTAYRIDADDPEPRAQAVLDAFVAELELLYGTADVVWNRLIFGAYHRGAVFAELVLDESGRVPIDLATPDPATVRFKKEIDPARPARGPIWRAGQWQAGEFVLFDRPTICYVPVDPFPGSPYGRPLGAPALFTSLFLMGMLADLRRVVQQQGWPRLDIILKSEQLATQMPAEVLTGTPQQRADWVQSKLDEVASQYAQLEPDMAFIHLDTVEMGSPQGVVDASALGSVEPIVALLQRQQVQAVKTMPLLLGLSEGVSEANANRQWEIHAAGVKALQHLIETPLSRLLSVALQAGGLAARAELRFAELRAAEMMRDEQTRAIKDANVAFERDQGWIDQDAAAQDAVGHPPVGPPSPFAPTKPGGTGAGGGGFGGGAGVDTQTNPEPGSSRSLSLDERTRSDVDRAAMTQRLDTEQRLEPLGAAAALPSITREPVLAAGALDEARGAWERLIAPPHDDLLDATLAEPPPARANGHAAASLPAG